MNRDEAEEYTQGLEQSLSGGYRLYAWAQRNGVPKALGLSTEEWIGRIGGHVKLSGPDRRSAVEELKADGHSNREIGKLLGVDETTVRRDAAANAAPDEENDNSFNGHGGQAAANAAHDNGGPIEEPCTDCATDEERWQRSLSNMAGDAVSLPSYWMRQFGQWDQFGVPRELATLATQAAEAWQQIASDHCDCARIGRGFDHA